MPAYVFWPLAALFVLVDVAFLFANLVKFMDGAWFPIALGIVVFTLLRTWGRGRQLLQAEILKDGIRLDTFLPGLMLSPPTRVPGTAVFLTAQTGIVPKALLHNLKHNKVLHERNVLLTVETKARAVRRRRVAADDRHHRRRLPSRDDPLRLHGNAGRAAGADALRRQRRPVLRSDGDDVLRQPRNHRRQPATRHGDLARQAVRLLCTATRRRRRTSSAFPTRRLVELGAPVEI